MLYNCDQQQNETMERDDHFPLRKLLKKYLKNRKYAALTINSFFLRSYVGIIYAEFYLGMYLSIVIRSYLT